MKTCDRDVSADNETFRRIAVSVGIFGGWDRFDEGDVIRWQGVLACPFDDKPLVPRIGAERRINVSFLGYVNKHGMATALRVNDQSYLLGVALAEALVRVESNFSVGSISKTTPQTASVVSPVKHTSHLPEQSTLRL